MLHFFFFFFFFFLNVTELVSLTNHAAVPKRCRFDRQSIKLPFLNVVLDFFCLFVCLFVWMSVDASTRVPYSERLRSS